MPCAIEISCIIIIIIITGTCTTDSIIVTMFSCFLLLVFFYCFWKKKNRWNDRLWWTQPSRHICGKLCFQTFTRKRSWNSQGNAIWPNTGNCHFCTVKQLRNTCKFCYMYLFGQVTDWYFQLWVAALVPTASCSMIATCHFKRWKTEDIFSFICFSFTCFWGGFKGTSFLKACFGQWVS